jgi:nitronate monooxygenase
MSIPSILKNHLRLPVVAAPMFIVSSPELVIAQCTAGIVGSFPALNARPAQTLDHWLSRIQSALVTYQQAYPEAYVAPFAVNQIVHHSNDRLMHDMEICEKHRVPIIITSLQAPNEIVKHVHAYGGLVFHDVISVRHAKKALEAGVDGLIVVCAGAGGHAGNLIRQFYEGLILLSGAITNGAGILAAQAMGADLAYIGTRFIATHEANANAEYKAMLVNSHAADIVNSNLFTGVHGNYLRGSIERAGFDPNA